MKFPSGRVIPLPYSNHPFWAIQNLKPPVKKQKQDVAVVPV